MVTGNSKAFQLEAGLLAKKEKTGELPVFLKAEN
jgi:hypothetical protein